MKWLEACLLGRKKKRKLGRKKKRKQKLKRCSFFFLFFLHFRRRLLTIGGVVSFPIHRTSLHGHIPETAGCPPSVRALRSCSSSLISASFLIPLLLRCLPHLPISSFSCCFAFQPWLHHKMPSRPTGRTASLSKPFRQACGGLRSSSTSLVRTLFVIGTRHEENLDLRPKKRWAFQSCARTEKSESVDPAQNKRISAVAPAGGQPCFALVALVVLVDARNLHSYLGCPLSISRFIAFMSHLAPIGLLYRHVDAVSPGCAEREVDIPGAES